MSIYFLVCPDDGSMPSNGESDSHKPSGLSKNPKESTNEKSMPTQPRVRFDLPDPKPKIPKPTNRKSTVYDAVAGRVTLRGFNKSHPSTSRNRDTQSSSARELRPEEIVHRGRRKFLKKLENLEIDAYFARDKLPADRPLPDSALLTAIHAYTSDFYTNMRAKGKQNFRSMDDSALLAFGILTEELANEQLGKNGDLVLTEPKSTGRYVKRIRPGNKQRNRSRSNARADPSGSRNRGKGLQQKSKRHRLGASEHEATGNEAVQEGQSPKKKQKSK